MKTAFSCLLIVTAWGASAPDLQAQTTRIGIERGSTPAAVTLERLDGEGGVVDLSEAIGHKPVLLEFWAIWCENCKALHPHMLEAHDRFGDRVAFYAVAVGVNQSPKRIRQHLEKYPVPFPTLWDERGAAVREFEAPNTSYIVVLDSQGRVTYTGTGREQDLEAAIRTGL
jgi:thiol-disulfide isomerase/thioredoxin